MTRLLAVLLIALPLYAAAQNVYRTVDENGNVVFTDTPSGDAVQAERMEIRETNRAPAVEQQSQAAPEAGSVAVKAVSYNVSIVTPANETSFPMGPGDFSVSAQVSPELGDGESLQLFIDGAPWGAAQRGTGWALTNVFRGAHDLTVAVVDGKGEQLATSNPTRVFVHRPSVNFRRAN